MDMRDNRKTKVINIKLSPKEFVIIKAKAAKYNDGNVSKFLRMAACVFDNVKAEKNAENKNNIESKQFN